MLEKNIGAVVRFTSERTQLPDSKDVYIGSQVKSQTEHLETGERKILLVSATVQLTGGANRVGVGKIPPPRRVLLNRISPRGPASRKENSLSQQPNVFPFVLESHQEIHDPIVSIFEINACVPPWDPASSTDGISSLASLLSGFCFVCVCSIRLPRTHRCSLMTSSKNEVPGGTWAHSM